MPVQTEAQRQAALAAAGVNPASLPPSGTTPAPISVSSISTPQAPLNITPIIPAPLPTLSTTITPVQPEKPAPAPTPSPFISQLDQLQAQVSGKAADTEAIKAEYSLPAEKALNEIKTQLATHQANRIARQEKALATGDTLGFAAGEAQRIARTDAIEEMRLLALQAGAQGNIALAEKQATNAINTKYAQIEKDTETAKSNIYNNWDTFSETEKKRAKATLLRLDKEDAFVAQAKADETLIFQTANIALQNGADMATVQKMYNAKTPQEAVLIGSTYMQDPKAKYQLESARLDNILKQEELKNAPLQRSLTQAQINKIVRETGEIGKPTPTERKQAIEDEQKAKSTIPLLNDKIALIDSLVSHKGLNSAVGTAFTGRIGVADKFSGAKQDFIAGVQQLVSKDTLDTLINLKAQGGTLGALSDTERIMLQSAASKIGTWAVRDKNGNVKGYNINQANMQKELNIIKSLAERARTKAQGEIISTDEQAVLDTFFNDSNSTSSSFNPAEYF